MSKSRQARWIALTSRLGVWGLVVALVPPLAEALGGHSDWRGSIG